MIFRSISVLSLVLACASCGRVAPLPSDTFYRLADIGIEYPSAVGRWTEYSVVINRIRASGIYKDRALARLKTDGVSLVQSNYDYWNDSPEIMVQQRIFAHAIQKNIAPRVSLNAVDNAAYQINGRLMRFEAIELSDGGLGVAVELTLSVQSLDGDSKFAFENTLKYSQNLQSTDINVAVKAISLGLDTLIARFLNEASEALAAQGKNSNI